MGRIAPPRSLTRDELKNRVSELEKQGKPLTFENIDPEFHRWWKEGQKQDLCLRFVFVLGFLGMTVVAILLLFLKLLK